MPIALPGVAYSWAGDEHGRLDLAPRRAEIEVGDRLEFIPPHCDPTVNLYDRIYALRGDRRRGRLADRGARESQSIKRGPRASRQALRDLAIRGEVRFDRLSRALYSTDASVYQIEPLASSCHGRARTSPGGHTRRGASGVQSRARRRHLASRPGHRRRARARHLEVSQSHPRGERRRALGASRTWHRARRPQRRSSNRTACASRRTFRPRAARRSAA